MAVQYKDYYQTLGVAKTASKEEIRSAFRKLARTHHPDVAKDKKTAEAKFKEINEAYEVLGDPDKRQKYDTLGADWDREGRGQPSPGWGGGMGGGRAGGGASFNGTGFSDFFEQFFSGKGGRGPAGGGNPFAGYGQGGASNGEDVEADLLVSLEEALHGAKKTISFRRDGSQRVETFEVKIPKGVREGQKIRLAGQGSAGGRGMAAGDLLLRVRFERHPDYRVDGADLIYKLEMPAWKAVLGAEVEVPTPEGAIRLKIGPGSQPGRKFRLKARGLPTADGSRGDLYVQLEVSLPTTLNAEQEALWKQISGNWA